MRFGALGLGFLFRAPRWRLRVSGFLFWDCAHLGGHGGGVVGFQGLAGFKVVR